MAYQINWWKFERDKEEAQRQRDLVVVNRQRRNYRIRKGIRYYGSVVAAIVSTILVLWLLS